MILDHLRSINWVIYHFILIQLGIKDHSVSWMTISNVTGIDCQMCLYSSHYMSSYCNNNQIPDSFAMIKCISRRWQRQWLYSRSDMQSDVTSSITVELRVKFNVSSWNLTVAVTVVVLAKTWEKIIFYSEIRILLVDGVSAVKYMQTVVAHIFLLLTCTNWHLIRINQIYGPNRDVSVILHLSCFMFQRWQG